MSAESIFNAMRAIIEAPGSPFLRSYKQDFYTIDKAFLEVADAPKSEYLWAISPDGTHMAYLGAHSRDHESASAIVSCAATSGRLTAFYHATNARLLEISAAQAADLVKKKCRYETGSNFVSRTGEDHAIAEFAVAINGGTTGQPFGEVSFASWPDDPLDLNDLVALWRIGINLVVEHSGSLFTPTKELTLNGDDLHEIIRARQQAAQPSSPLRLVAA